MRATILVLWLVAAGCGGGGSTAASDMTVVPDLTVLVNGCPQLMTPLAQPGDPIGGDSWNSFAKGSFAMWCTRCHSTTAADRQGAPVGYDWDNLAAVRNYLPLIRTAVGVSNFMPPTAPLPSCSDRSRLVRWIDAAAP